MTKKPLYGKTLGIVALLSIIPTLAILKDAQRGKGKNEIEKNKISADNEALEKMYEKMKSDIVHNLEEKSIDCVEKIKKLNGLRLNRDNTVSILVDAEIKTNGELTYDGVFEYVFEGTKELEESVERHFGDEVDKIVDLSSGDQKCECIYDELKKITQEDVIRYRLEYQREESMKKGK